MFKSVEKFFGLEKFEIEYNSRTGVFLPGGLIQGHVVITVKDTIKAKSVIVSIVGMCETSWVVWRDNSFHNDCHDNYYNDDKYYSAIETYIDFQTPIWHSKDKDNNLTPGNYRFPFCFQLPNYCPPTYEGEHGYIRYFCKAIIDRPWKVNYDFHSPIVVVPHFDLNTAHHSHFPLSTVLYKQVGFLCCTYGSLKATVTLSKAGYVPGECLILNIDINNKTSKEIKAIEATLFELSTFTAYRNRYFDDNCHSRNNFFRNSFYENDVDIGIRKESRIVFQHSEPFKVDKNSSAVYEKNLIVPPTVPSFDCCKFIQVDYYFTINIVITGALSGSLSGELPILIGTIPVQKVKSLKNAKPLTQNYLVPPRPMGAQQDKSSSSQKC